MRSGNEKERENRIVKKKRGIEEQRTEKRNASIKVQLFARITAFQFGKASILFYLLLFDQYFHCFYITAMHLIVVF